MQRRIAVLLVGLVSGTAAYGVAAAATGTPAAATYAGSFAVQASADGVRTTVTSAGFLIVEQPVDVGAPSAQARVDSIGNSNGYAAQPYPGALVLAVPALAGHSDDVGYPLIAHSDFPARPSDKVDQPGYSLRAASAPDLSEASVVTGSSTDQQSVGRTQAHAYAHADLTTGVLTATSESTSEALSFGGVLTLGRVHSLARVVLPPGQPAQLSSALELSQVTVAGVTVELTQGGLVVAGTTVPIGQTPLGDALEQAGVTLHYLAPSPDQDKHGIVSAGLVVTVTHDVTGTGATSVSYTLGRTSARAAGSLTATGSGAATTTGTGASTSSSTTGAAGGPPAATAAGPAAAPGPAATGDGSAGASLAAPVIAASPRRAAGGMVALAGATRGFDTGALYLALVVGAVAALGSAQLIRLLGVRLRWIPRGGL